MIKIIFNLMNTIKISELKEKLRLWGYKTYSMIILMSPNSLLIILNVSELNSLMKQCREPFPFHETKPTYLIICDIHSDPL